MTSPVPSSSLPLTLRLQSSALRLLGDFCVCFSVFYSNVNTSEQLLSISFQQLFSLSAYHHNVVLYKLICYLSSLISLMFSEGKDITIQHLKLSDELPCVLLFVSWYQNIVLPWQRGCAALLGFTHFWRVVNIQ